MRMKKQNSETTLSMESISLVMTLWLAQIRRKPFTVDHHEEREVASINP